MAFSPGAAGPVLRPDWRLLAECQYTDPDLFHPEDAGQAWHAKRICRACPVRGECLDHALSASEEWGVWGGMTERQRGRLLAGRRRAERELAA
jgi:WhiB family redox-sensing transcriptional regulator